MLSLKPALKNSYQESPPLSRAQQSNTNIKLGVPPSQLGSLLAVFRTTLGNLLLPAFAKKWLSRTKTRPSATLLGIDMGPQRIYALAVAYWPATASKAAYYQLQAMVSVATPSGAIVDHQLQNIAAVSQALGQLRGLLKIRRRPVATAITGSGVTTKILHIPNSLPPEMLALHIQQQAATELPFSLADISLDFEILKVCEQHVDCDQVLLSAAQTHNVTARVEALRQAGWQVEVVDVGCHALARAACFLLAAQSAQVLAVLELNNDSLTFMVIVDTEIIFQRVQPWNGDITDAAASTDLGVNKGERHTVLIQQVQRQLQLFCSNSGQETPSTLLLCGGATDLTQLVAVLSESLGIPVQVPDFSRVFGGEAHLYPDAAAFSTALGLALRRGSHV